MLKSCVCRSIAARMGSATPLIATVAAPERRRRNGLRRQHKGVAAFERAIHGGDERLSQAHRAHVILGEEVSAHLQAHAHSR